MKNINIPAQIVMIIAFLFLTSSFWCKKRENILKLQIISSALFVVQYILLGAYTASVLNIISVIRAYIFRKKKETKQDNKNSKLNIDWSSKWVLYILILVYTIASLITSVILCLSSKDITADVLVSVFAYIATLVYTVGLWADHPQYIRLTANIASVFWVLTNFFSGGYAGCVTESILFTSNTIALIKNRDKKTIKILKILRNR